MKLPSGLELESSVRTPGSGTGSSILEELNIANNTTQTREANNEDENEKYIDIAPCLRTFCSCCPCCCCLFPSRSSSHIIGSEINSEDDDQSSLTPIPFLMNKNVLIILWLSFLYSLSDSLWDGTVFTTFLISFDEDREKYIGYLESVRALSNLISIAPIYFLAQNYGRSFTLKFAGVLNLYGVLLNTALIIKVGDGQDLSSTDKNMIFDLYFLVMVIEGTVNSVLQGPVIGLFAESVSIGYRSDFFVVQYIIFILASFFGPITSIFFFGVWGNNWDTSTLGNVLLVGMTLELFVSFTLFLTKDSWTLGEQEENISPPFDVSDRIKAIRHKYRIIVPLILFICSFVISSGFGMTIRFFPLYFKNDLDLTPIVVQLIYAFMPICVFIGSTAVRVSGAFIGRVPTIFTARLLGVSSMFVLAYATDSAETAILVLLFIFRMTCMNSTYPVAQSILMEFTDKEKRARWKNVESLTWLGWAFSAAVGGILVDKHDYTYAFGVTAIIQTFGVLLYLVLIPMVPEINMMEDTVIYNIEEHEIHNMNEPLIDDHEI